MHYSALLTALAFASTAFGHMEMDFPPPFRSKFNPNSKNTDYSMTSPLSGMAQYPCKGYASDFSDTTGAGKSVVTWAPGASANFSIVGGAPHGGGSCQAALSYDSGKTFTVIHSYEGNCPTSSGQKFDFTIPSDAKSGAAIFAWTWFNHIGNREMYMNCASVTIGGASKRDAAVEFSKRPAPFVANVGNGCNVAENIDLSFPDPGPDVTGTGTGKSTGTCAAGAAPASGSDSGGSASAAPPASSAAPPASSASGSAFVTSAAPAATSSAAPPTGTGTTGALVASLHGQCSGTQTCAGQSAFGNCCSKFGYCGDTDMHCGDGCQSAFGKCGSGAGNATSAPVKIIKGRYVQGGRPLRVFQ